MSLQQLLHPSGLYFQTKALLHQKIIYSEANKLGKVPWIQTPRPNQPGRHCRQQDYTSLYAFQNHGGLEGVHGHRQALSAGHFQSLASFCPWPTACQFLTPTCYSTQKWDKETGLELSRYDLGQIFFPVIFQNYRRGPGRDGKEGNKICLFYQTVHSQLSEDTFWTQYPRHPGELQSSANGIRGLLVS